ncbi:hypothetical protein [Haliangium sp.]|uniref:hypothetical protein n=1 Tax=Haliangium sp. TaxID=2663208 RepID=UPI003D0F129B
MKISPVLLAAALSLPLLAAGCTTSSGDASGSSDYADIPVKDVVSTQDLVSLSATGSAVLDLQSADIGYLVEPAVDMSRVDVICPTGRVFNLAGWLEALDMPTSMSERGLVLYSSGRLDTRDEVSTKAAPVCSDPDCYLHQEPDRTWVCFCP